MSLLDRIKGAKTKGFTEPNFWSLDHLRSPFFNLAGSDREKIENDFPGYVEGVFKRNGAAFACMAARQMVFTEARFLWRRFSNGRGGDLFFSKDLLLLDHPWPGATTGDLLAHMIQDADLAGNCYLTLADDDGNYGASAKGDSRRIVRMRPDHVELVLGSHSDDLMALDTKIILYSYKPPGTDIEVQLLPSEVSHFSPIPDPAARFRGMSWLTPILREIEGDTAATLHKKNFFEHAAVPNIAIKFDKETSEDDFDIFVEKFKENHQGAMNAYKTLFIMGGADVEPLTHDFKQIEFNATIGKGESRIAAASGVPSTWVGFSEGLSGSGLNSQGVYTAARRRFADGTMRPLWRMAAASLQNLLDVPAGAALWFDDRDIAFLREDSKDRAEIFQTEMSTVSQGIMAGFEPNAVVLAARDYDVQELIGNHSGLTSVQMVQSQPDKQAEQDEVEILSARASAIATLAGSGRYEADSIVDAVTSGDLTKLKEAEQPAPMPGLAPGQPKPAAGQRPAAASGSEPKEPAQEEDDQPGGAGNDRNSA